MGELALPEGGCIIAGAPEGVDAMVLGRLVEGGRTVIHVARDDARLYRLADQIAILCPDVALRLFPAWDCLPYDRVSPNLEIVSIRAATLAALADRGADSGPLLLLTTVNAALQRVPPASEFAGTSLELAPGLRIGLEALAGRLASQGYRRVGTVREPGEFGVRGGIVDLFPSGEEAPVRLDFFGDEIEGVRRFDPVSQKSVEKLSSVRLGPVGELVLDDIKVARFRAAYRTAFPEGYRTDPLYETVSAGQVASGVEHWLPFFFEHMETLFDQLPGATITLDNQAEQAVDARLDLIREYHDARREFLGSGTRTDAAPYRPISPELPFLTREEWDAKLRQAPATGLFSPFTAAPGGSGAMVDAGGRLGRDFTDVRADPSRDLFEAVRTHVGTLRTEGTRVVVTAFTPGSRERLGQLLSDHGVSRVRTAGSWAEVFRLPPDQVVMLHLPLDRGVALDGLALLTEQDILGDRLIRRPRRRRKAEDILSEISSLEEGDHVVHIDHGIGIYDGLQTVTAGGAPHDCLRIVYEGGDQLYVPVENMEVLSRFGSSESSVQLDRLGGAGWQSRKARVKKRIKEIADKLIAIAAERLLREGNPVRPVEGLYEEFAARFPYEETEDQQRAIADVLADLASGRPMDRLVCGDVGFGKTEVALRGAFAAVSEGWQVAVVVPTTLLARQHFATFRERFAGMPVRVEQLSRLASTRDAALTRKGLANGEVDIVIGTHAVLGKSVSFRKLGLLIVDEEQHFGVGQKERMKEMRADVHILTLTATPIPRTLQMALSGVRDMSLIATPPVDRIAVRTFVLPYDPVVIREAIQRELFRGGQVFYVCPRIEDLGLVAERIEALVPGVRFAVAHGRMSATELEGVMGRFYAGEVQILIATNIIESGLDIPSVNTIVIHRADRFGLAQLYQLRGRVGRSKTRAYAYLTLPEDRTLTPNAQRRLEVMQTLDTLGAGFTLASHDMDIRGAGNLVGEEQSGHVREVGVELYQQMLEEAVAAARTRADAGEKAGETTVPDEEAEAAWSPQISVGTPVLIPEAYVPDLTVRLGLYRRLSRLTDRRELDAFAAEMVDRFGPLPDEVGNLLDIIDIKALCHAAGVARVDAGPKGAVVSFHQDRFADPAGLVRYVAQQAGSVKIRPDQKVICRRQWDTAAARIKGVKQFLQQLARIAGTPADGAKDGAGAGAADRGVA